MTTHILKRTRSRTGARNLAVVATLVAATVALPVLPGASASPPDLHAVEVEIANWRSVPDFGIAASGEQSARPGSRSQGATTDTNGTTVQEGEEPPVQEGDWSLSDPIETDDLVMIGAEWGGGQEVLTQARTLVDGVWGEWIDLELPDGGPDPGTDEAAREKPVSEPLWIGGADAFQLRTTAEPTDLVVPALEAEGRLDFQASPPRFAPAADAASPQPTIVTRAQW